MSNKKATKRALLTSITALAMCVVMLVGTTFAWFTDTATANVNKIQAGNLDVDIVDASGNSLEGQTLYFRDKNNGTNILWEPGATFNLDTFKIVNKGNLAIKYEITVNGVTGSNKLLKAIDFTVTKNGTSVDLANLKGVLLPAGKTAAAGEEVGETAAIVISGTMKTSAGNEYKNLTLDGISITVKAMQASYEYDSNGNTYDDAADMTPDNLHLRASANVTKTVDPTQETEFKSESGTVSLTAPAGSIATEGDYTLSVVPIASGNITAAAGTAVNAYDIKLKAEDGTAVTATAGTKFTVQLKIGAGLKNVKVFHNGTEITPITYDETAGIVTFTTASFSIFDVQYDAPTAMIVGGECYTTLADAVAAAKDGATITLLKDSTENGVKGENKGFVIDLNGHTLKIGNPLVGSTGTETNGFQLLKSAGNVTFKNGTLTTEEAYILIQNYCNLTLDNMVLDGRNIPVHATRPDSVVRYTLSNNCGNVTINNSTIYAPETLGVAFDSCKYGDYAIPTVTVSGNSTIYGRIEETGGNIVIKGGSFTDLANAVKYAADGATIKLVADAAGSGLASADGAKVRDNLTIDFAGHTYTMVNPAVGSKGTETQAMHWGTSLRNITMKNGTFKVAGNATEVAMAMQNYINFTAEGMTFDFTGIPVAHYAADEFTGANAIFNGKECPMFNNNGGEVVLTNCVVTLPETSNFGGIISGTMELNDTAFNGYVGFNDIDGTVIVNGTSSIKGGEVKDYFGDLAIVNNNGTWTATKNA